MIGKSKYTIILLLITVLAGHLSAVAKTTVRIFDHADGCDYTEFFTAACSLSHKGATSDCLSSWSGPCSTTPTDNKRSMESDSDTTISMSVCQNMLPINYHGTMLTAAGSYTVVIPTVDGSDSTIVITLNVIQNPSDTILDTIVENQIPHTWRGLTFNDKIDTSIVVPTPAGCDSLIIYSLTVWNNQNIRLVENICDDTLPFVWYGYTFSADDSVSFTVTDSHGADSTVTLVVYVHPTYSFADTVVVCPWRPFIYRGIDYGGPTEVDLLDSTIYGCDSIMHAVLMPRDSAYRPQILYNNKDFQELDGNNIVMGCAPDTLWLYDTSSASVSWRWSVRTTDTAFSDTSSGVTITYEEHNHLLSSVDSFTVVVTDTLGCLDTVSHPIYVFRSPVAIFDWYPVLPSLTMPHVQFRNGSQPDDLSLLPGSPRDSIYYLWNIEREPGGSIDTSTQYEPYYSWGNIGDVDTGTYNAQLITYWTQYAIDTAIHHTCIDTNDQPITITNDYLQFPNVVSPNGDGVNDTWRIVNLLEYGLYTQNELRIYNNNGILIYHKKNIAEEDDFWDPLKTHSPNGTYFFRFSARSIYGIVKRNGVIEVLGE